MQKLTICQVVDWSVNNLGRICSTSSILRGAKG